MRALRLPPAAEQVVDGEEVDLREASFVFLRYDLVARAIEVLGGDVLSFRV
jgi:hypothetical protein